MKYIVLSLTVLLFAAASCTKITDPTSRESVLRNGNWKFTNGTIEYKIPYKGKDTVVADTAYKSGCTADNYLVFGQNHDGTVNTGSSKCNPSESDTYSFYWEMLNDDNNIRIYNADAYFGYSDIQASITNFSNSSFTMKYMTTFTYPNVTDTSKKIIDSVYWTMTLSKS